jgi:hypothetical protein
MAIMLMDVTSARGTTVRMEAEDIIHRFVQETIRSAISEQSYDRVADLVD